MSIFARYSIRALLCALAFLLIWMTAAAPRSVFAAETLERNYDYGVFVAGKRVQVTSAPISLAEGQAFFIRGWVLDGRTMKPGSSLLVSKDNGAAKVVHDYPIARHDVAVTLKDHGAEWCGFEIGVPNGLVPGTHRYHFTLVGKDSVQIGLSTDVQLSVAHR